MCGETVSHAALLMTQSVLLPNVAAIIEPEVSGVLRGVHEQNRQTAAHVTTFPQLQSYKCGKGCPPGPVQRQRPEVAAQACLSIWILGIQSMQTTRGGEVSTCTNLHLPQQQGKPPTRMPMRPDERCIHVKGSACLTCGRAVQLTSAAAERHGQKQPSLGFENNWIPTNDICCLQRSQAKGSPDNKVNSCITSHDPQMYQVYCTATRIKWQRPLWFLGSDQHDTLDSNPEK